MKGLFLVLCMAITGNAFAASSDEQPEAAIHQFLDSFNNGDLEGAQAAHADSVVIVDEVPPFQWRGEDAFKTWLDDLTKYDAANGVTDGHMAMGDTIRQDLSGDSAYIVMATVYSFKEHGVAVHAAAQMTFALRKADAGWRISAWTYSAPSGTPVQP